LGTHQLTARLTSPSCSLLQRPRFQRTGWSQLPVADRARPRRPHRELVPARAHTPAPTAAAPPPPVNDPTAKSACPIFRCATIRRRRSSSSMTLTTPPRSRASSRPATRSPPLSPQLANAPPAASRLPLCPLLFPLPPSLQRPPDDIDRRGRVARPPDPGRPAPPVQVRTRAGRGGRGCGRGDGGRLAAVVRSVWTTGGRVLCSACVA